MNRFKEMLLILQRELRRTFRSSRSVVFLLIYALVAGLGAFIFAQVSGLIDENVTDEMRTMAANANLNVYQKIVETFFGEEASSLEWLMSMPPFLLFFYKFNLLCLPALVVLTCFDQISTELESGSVRYLAPRVHRSAIVLGKFASSMILVLALSSLMTAVSLVLMTHSTPTEAGAGAIFLGAARFEAMTMLALLPYLSLTFLFSSIFRTPLYALMLSACAVLLFWLLGVLANFESLSFLKWLTPANYEPGLLSAQITSLLKSSAAFIAFAAVFLGGAILRMNKADL